MALKDQVANDMKQAMKAGDKIRLETLRSIRALILEFEKSGTKKDITPDDELSMINKAVKRRKESIEQYLKGNRQDLVDKETKELEILMSFMPKQLTEDEIEAVIKELAKKIDAKDKNDFPKLMPLAMKELKGKAEGKTVKAIVEKTLGVA